MKPETFEVLAAAAEALGQSRSRFVGDLLDSAVPVMQAVADAARVLRDASDRRTQAFQQLAEEMAPLKAEGDELQGQLVDLMGRIVAESAADPRPSNTGVRN